MEERPKLKIKLEFIDKFCELVGWLAIIVIWALVIINYTKLPDIIPTHYDGLGHADGFGTKSNILILPIVVTIVFIALSIVNKFPQSFNYPTSVTKENALKQYTIATKLIRYLKFIIALIFGFITFKTIQNAQNNTSELGIWFLPLILSLVFIPTIYSIAKMIKSKK